MQWLPNWIRRHFNNRNRRRLMEVISRFLCGLGWHEARTNINTGMVSCGICKDVADWSRERVS